ncbi:hypothetical protein GALL_113560 [mine drainage metagenome]|uniref:Uncharacterized protein n=1 Tax=mine drainage metagenome TaxID=410659 RepID=A0A1J5SD79_9ZZZZ
MIVLASASIDKLRQVPMSFWFNVAIVIVGFVGGIWILRRIREMNKIILMILICLFLSMVGFNWIYQRNEPHFLTPLIDRIAPFFPSKGKH